MPIHFDWRSAELHTFAHEFRGPMIAFGVALALALVGRFLRTGLPAAAAGGAGVMAGWYAISGRLWVVTPRASVDDLALLAAVLLVIGLLCTRLGPGRGATIGIWLAAAFAGWWLCGAPTHQVALRSTWPIGLGVAAAVLLMTRMLTANVLDRLGMVLAGATLAASLHMVGAPAVWTMLALVPDWPRWRSSRCRRCRPWWHCRSLPILPQSGA